jgi:pimeloyl-ACP methyl ester carboxylesterase
VTDQLVLDEIGGTFVEHVVEADGFRIRYDEAGSGDPVVMLHGAGGPKHTLAQDRLAEIYRVLTFEMPGWGSSEPNTRTNSLEELAETMAAAVEALGIEQYHLLGHSLGGAVAVLLAIAHPNRVRHLVLEAPATFRVGAVPRPEDPEERIRCFRAHPERPPAFTPPGPEHRAKTGPLIQKLLDRPLYDEHIAARLESLETPTLVLFGTKDGITNPENGRTYKKLMPNATYVLVYDAAHLIQQDRPEAFADVTTDFLERGLAFLVPETSSLINP